MEEKIPYETTDWLEKRNRDKEKIIDEIASEVTQKYPELFEGEALIGDKKERAEAIIRMAVTDRDDVLPQNAEEFVNKIMGQLSGYGVLQDFFTPEAEEITEIFINPTTEGPKVFYSKRGKSYQAKERYFKNDEEVRQYVRRICEDAGRPFTEEAPIVDAWLKDRSRLAVAGYKVTPLGTAVSIRKSPTSRPPLPMDKLVESGTLPPFVAEMLIDTIVDGHANLGVFGRTDSGKTTFLRALGRHINPEERTFIAETSFEFFEPHLKNCVNMVEVVYGDKTIVNMSQLVKTMNRNNPDRAIVGELRSKEIIAASQIASSTSGGFWTTGHAGDVNDLRTRMFGMFLDGGVQLPKDFLDEIIASMFHFVIFLDKENLTDNKQRTLMSLVEVIPGGYRTIIEFDRVKFYETNGKVRRWIYKDSISEERLSQLAFSGAKIKPDYQRVSYEYLYDKQGDI